MLKLSYKDVTINVLTHYRNKHTIEIVILKLIYYT